jgi:hypothetical protein
MSRLLFAMVLLLCFFGGYAVVALVREFLDARGVEGLECPQCGGRLVKQAKRVWVCGGCRMVVVDCEGRIKRKRGKS